MRRRGRRVPGTFLGTGGGRPCKKLVTVAKADGTTEALPCGRVHGMPKDDCGRHGHETVTRLKQELVPTIKVPFKERAGRRAA